ncbi:MAG: Gfo/Idh/MocA family protein [Phycisphaerae bacterium]
MPGEPLDVAVIGLGGVGERVINALVELECVRIAGVSDKDPTTAKQVGNRLGVPHYVDNRSMLAECRPSVAFVSVPSMAAPDIVAACAERKIHLWKQAPLARDLDEAHAMVKRMDQAGVKFAVGTHRRFAPGYRHARDTVAQLGEVFLARAHYLFNWGPRLSWRGDMASAGGGALLELGYHPLDLLVWMLGFPEEVYGVSAAGHRDTAAAEGEPVPVYDTDDTAAVVLRYKSGAMATVVTCRASGPMSEELNLHGSGGSLQANGDLCVVRDPDGNILDHTPPSPDPQEAYRQACESFVQAIVTDAQFYENSARESLLTQAMIEASYLASRTGQPETPLKRLGNLGLSVEDCLVHQQPAVTDLPLPDEETD